jgi:hypothetical protein
MLAEHGQQERDHESANRDDVLQAIHRSIGRSRCRHGSHQVHEVGARVQSHDSKSAVARARLGEAHH